MINMENLIIIGIWLCGVVALLIIRNHFSDKNVLIRDLRKRGLDRQADIIESL